MSRLSRAERIEHQIGHSVHCCLPIAMLAPFCLCGNDDFPFRVHPIAQALEKKLPLPGCKDADIRYAQARSHLCVHFVDVLTSRSFRTTEIETDIRMYPGRKLSSFQWYLRFSAVCVTILPWERLAC